MFSVSGRDIKCADFVRDVSIKEEAAKEDQTKDDKPGEKK